VTAATRSSRRLERDSGRIIISYQISVTVEVESRSPAAVANVVPPTSIIEMTQSNRVVHPVVDSTAVFKDDIFKNKVLLCTGGGSGICRVMTEAVVSRLRLDRRALSTPFIRCDMVPVPPS
jgi:hypothetical protein